MRQLFITAALLLPLGLDTFALAAALGMAGVSARDRIRVSAVFTGFEAVMPLIGLLIGSAADRFIGQWAAYGGIALVAIAGVLIIRSGRHEDEEQRRLGLLAHTRGVAVIGLGVSISVDELAIGISAGLLGIPLAAAIPWIAVQTFVAAQVGMRVGGRLGETVRERTELAAGLALILVAGGLLALRLFAL